jgi:cobalamin synthase
MMVAVAVEVVVEVVSSLAVLWQPVVRSVVRAWLMIPVAVIVFQAVREEEMGMVTGDVEGVVGDLLLLLSTLLLLY